MPYVDVLGSWWKDHDNSYFGYNHQQEGEDLGKFGISTRGVHLLSGFQLDKPFVDQFIRIPSQGRIY